ncbi:MAG: peroxiredoxin-like family protein [Acidobacteriota bacterium]
MPIGTPAPRLDLPTPSGERRSLREFHGRPVMISFLGPAHCLFCRAHVIRVIQARNELDSLGAGVIFVAHNDPELLTTKMLHDLDLPYTLLLDPTRMAYAQWGLGRAGPGSWLSPGLYWAGLTMAVKVWLKKESALGNAPGRNQLGGDFVVDRAGKVVFENRLKSFHDRAKIADLLAALQGAPI